MSGTPPAGGQNGGPYGGPYGGVYDPRPMRPEDERLWATLINVGGIFFSFVPSLLGFLILRDRGPFIRDHCRVALNFQLTMLIGGVVAGATWIFVIGVLLSIAIGIVTLIFSILAALAANRGQYYRYPLSIQFFGE